MLGSTKNFIQFFNFNFWREIKTGVGGFKPQLKFIKFGHWRLKTRVEQALFDLKIKNKSGSSINPDISK